MHRLIFWGRIKFIQTAPRMALERLNMHGKKVKNAVWLGVRGSHQVLVVQNTRFDLVRNTRLIENTSFGLVKNTRLMENTRFDLVENTRLDLVVAVVVRATYQRLRVWLIMKPFKFLPRIGRSLICTARRQLLSCD